ncbi:MAG: type I methionyl aminopeptidase [Elusimicrobia bacterium]|nr:type I methionyl aminopeptidase [Elusimicrobiota bacterium]
MGGADIRLKTPQEIATMREAGRILAGIFEEIRRSLKIGMTTADVDAIAEKMIHDNGVGAAFKGYRGYPACACVSVNDEVVHGIPGPRLLKDGDIVSIDLGIIYRNYYSDMAMTLGVGDISSQARKLLDVTRQALKLGIAEAKPGNRLGDVSSAVQRYAEGKGFSIVRDFVGHGIGTRLHEDPEIPNYGSPRTGILLKEGMVLAIEPMVNAGTARTKMLKDGWTAVTADRHLSAHFEHTVAITNKGPVILTA